MDLQSLKYRNTELTHLIQIKQLKLVIEALNSKNLKLEEMCKEMGKKLNKKVEEGKRLVEELVKMRGEMGRTRQREKIRKIVKGKEGETLTRKEIYEIVEQVQRRRNTSTFISPVHTIPPPLLLSSKPSSSQQTTLDTLLLSGIPSSISNAIQKKSQYYFPQLHLQDLKEILMRFIGSVQNEEMLVESSGKLFQQIRERERKKEEEWERVREIVRKFVEEGRSLGLDEEWESAG